LAAAAVFGASVALASVPAAGQGDAPCDRACLETFVDQFLAALVAHDAARAPFAADAKYTENGQHLRLDQGLWKTASANSTYRLTFADPEHGQVGFIGVIQENATPAIIALRLKVGERMIREAEMIASRVQQGGFARVEKFTRPLPVLVQPLTPEQRVPREQLIAAADAYFTGLDTEDTGANVPFDERCQRRENGAITAGSPEADASPMAKLGCKAQFDTGFSAFVTAVRERRYPLVDEERGLVYAVVFFDHAGNVESYTRPDGTVVPVNAAFRRPLTFMIGELFKIESGNIREIEAVLLEVPYGMPSGWEPF
jgi:hypothetical protein